MKHTQPANIAYSGISFIIETEMIASPMNGKGNRNHAIGCSEALRYKSNGVFTGVVGVVG